MVSNHREAAQASHHFPSRQTRRCLLKYIGVRKRSWGRWVAEIRVPKSRERLWLGSYANPHQAARAYDVAATCLRGPAAARNLPYHVVPHPPERRLSPASIRAFAMQEAACFSLSDQQQLHRQHLGPPYTVPPPLLSEQSSLQETQPSDQRVSCSSDTSLNYHLACATEQLHSHQISSPQLQGFQHLVPTELDQNTHLQSQVEVPSVCSEPPGCENGHARDQPLNGAASLLDLWFSLDIGPAVHPSLKALLRHSLYPEHSHE